MSILIKNGRVVTASNDFVGDVFIKNEKIAVIGTSLNLTADKVIVENNKFLGNTGRVSSLSDKHRNHNSNLKSKYVSTIIKNSCS